MSRRILFLGLLFSIFVEWFENNFMKLNQGKCHILVSGHKPIWVTIGKTKIWESNKKSLLRVVIDINLNFDEYIFLFMQKSW